VTGRGLPIDAGLLDRFRAAGAQIAWREASPPGRGASAKPAGRARKAGRAPGGAPRRIAHLNDEECTVEEHQVGPTTSIVVDSGPVGALVLLLELERRGPPALLATHEADPSTPFPSGAIEARWDDGRSTPDYSLPLGDLILLARYALA
jgi:hypothetical protein